MSIYVEEDELVRGTRLIGIKGGWRYEMSVEVDDKPLAIYDKDDVVDGIARDVVRGYIASQESKRYIVKYSLFKQVTDAKGPLKSYPGISVQCLIDGVRVYGTTHSGGSSVRHGTISGRSSSGSRVYKFLFSPLQNTEEDTPSVNLGELGTIELRVRRSRLQKKKESTESSSKKEKSGKISLEACKVNEKLAKGSMVGAMTTFGEASGESSADEGPSSVKVPNGSTPKRSIKSWHYHPKDIKSAFFTMRLRYAPEELLIANKHMPGKIEDKNDLMDTSPALASSSSPNILFPEPGLEPQLNLGSKTMSEGHSSSSLSFPSTDASQLDDDPNHANVGRHGECEANKRPRSPERNEAGSEEDTKRIKISPGDGLCADDPIDLGDESDDSVLSARALLKAQRAKDIQEYKAKIAALEMMDAMDEIDAGRIKDEDEEEVAVEAGCIQDEEDVKPEIHQQNGAPGPSKTTAETGILGEQLAYYPKRR